VRGNLRQLIDVTVVRPTTLTLLRGPARTGSHLRPLVAAAAAERRKHGGYDVECAKHGCTWLHMPSAVTPPPSLPADRMLSGALQAGNAAVDAHHLRLLAKLRHPCTSAPVQPTAPDCCCSCVLRHIASAFLRTIEGSRVIGECRNAILGCIGSR
jgi:hypothetical protein